MAYIGVYLLAHWLLPFNPYDRYLLPIVPLIMIVVAGNLRGLFSSSRWQYAPAIIVAVIAILFAFNALRTTEGQHNIGRDSRPRQNDIIKLAGFLNHQPLGTIIYDHWLGYELDYYLGAWTDKRRVYYPEPQIMAEDALKNIELVARYFVAPSEEPINHWLYTFKSRGFRLEALKISPDYQVYQIIPVWDDAVSE